MRYGGTHSINKIDSCVPVERFRGRTYDHRQEPVLPADVVGNHVRLNCWCALDDLARHHCPLSRCTPAAAISWGRTGDGGAVVDRGRSFLDCLRFPSAIRASSESLVTSSSAPACRNRLPLARSPYCCSSLPWWRILSPRRQPRHWLIAQPKGYAAFLLFPHLKLIPLGRSLLPSVIERISL